MKQGDLVRFTNRNHTSYRKLAGSVGIITEIDHAAVDQRSLVLQHLGAKVTVSFDGQEPANFTEFSLEVISENR